MSKLASVLIPFSGSANLLQSFFENFAKSHELERYEIILIGDGCKNEEAIRYAKGLMEKKLISDLILLPDPIGFGQANNIAVERSSTNRLVFINDDIVLLNHEIDILLKEQNRLRCAAIQPILLYPQTNTVQSSGHIFGPLFNRHAQQGCKITNIVLEQPIERQALTLSFCSIDKQSFSSIGGFNSFYFNAYEGLELTHRIHAKGWGCKVTAKTFSYHIQGSTRNNSVRTEEQYCPYFWIRNQATIQEDIIYEWLRTKDSNISFGPYLGINFSPLKIMHLVRQAGFTFREIFECAHKGKINLLTELPFSFIHMPQPFLLLCDSFKQIEENYLWLKLRIHKEDIVLDTHGNIFRLEKILA